MYKYSITPEQYTAITEYGLNQLMEMEGIEADELHHNLYLTDYFECHNSQAMEFMSYKAFDFIGIVQKYEQDAFGECFTDLSNPCKVLNRVADIIGEEWLQESTILQGARGPLTKEQLKRIAEELS